MLKIFYYWLNYKKDNFPFVEKHYKFLQRSSILAQFFKIFHYGFIAIYMSTHFLSILSFQWFKKESEIDVPMELILLPTYIEALQNFGNNAQSLWNLSKHIFDEKHIESHHRNKTFKSIVWGNTTRHKKVLRKQKQNFKKRLKHSLI